ncbi:35541_t:CDS:2, partial [Gigaspora margarita]
FTVKEITCIVRLSNNDPTKIIYLKVKAFVPLNDTCNHYIESFSPGDVVFLKEKFIGNENFYIVITTSIKVINFEFDDMPVLGINSVVVGITNQTVKNIENDLILEFYIKEKVGDREPSSFWIEARHNVNNKYLANKTNAINQNSRSTTAILIGTITYEISTEKHVIILEDISLITSGRNDSTAQSITLPWLFQSSIPGYTRANRQPQSAALKTPKKGRSTLSNMGLTSVPHNQTLSRALETNSIPNMSTH